MSGTTAIAWPVRRNYESFTDHALLWTIGTGPAWRQTAGNLLSPYQHAADCRNGVVERKGKTELGWITWTPETCEITIRTEYFQK